RSAGAVAHGRATVGVFGQLDFTALLHPRQDLGFNVIRIHAGHRVILLAALMPLGVAAAVGDHNGDDRRQAFLRDQVVEYARQFHVRFALGTVVADHEWRFAARQILGRNVNGYLTLVVDGVGFDDQSLGVLWVHLPEDLSGNPWIEEFGLLRIDGEL